MCPSPTITFIIARLPRMETAPLVRLKRSRRGRERRQRGLSQSSVIRSAQVNCSCQTKLCTTAASTAMAVAARELKCITLLTRKSAANCTPIPIPPTKLNLHQRTNVDGGALTALEPFVNRLVIAGYFLHGRDESC